MLSLVAVSTLLLGANALTPSNIMRRTDGSLTGIKYTGVGGSGSYQEVTNMVAGTWPSCTANPSCEQSPKEVSGNLAPFDDEITVAFRGPLNVKNIAVYQPGNSSAATWSQTSSWAAGGATNNLVFMNNMGGGLSGQWTICGGASQSYANGTWDGSAASPTTGSSGYLPETMEINIMTNETCADSACSGFSRGTANHGWSGSKLMVLTFNMPPSSDASNVPAIWALNAQVVRAAQYGCNCRGEGGNGGCGELDILEVIAGSDTDNAISEIYSFKGATGSGASAFPRPTGDDVTYGVIFDVQSDTIAIQQFTEWDFTQNAVPRSIIEGYLGASGAMAVSFSSNARRADRRSIFVWLVLASTLFWFWLD